MKDTAKVFISQRMFGRTDEDILAERERAQTAICNAFPDTEITFIDTFSHDGIPKDAGRLVHLGKSIQQLDEADFVYFCPGWESANGCRIEKKVCTLYGIPCFFEDEL